MSPIPAYKLVVLGEGGVGKTALTIQMCLGHFVESYDPTIEDSYRKNIELGGTNALLEILDTAGQEEYTSLRDQWIRGSDGFVLAYSIDSRTSFTQLTNLVDAITRVHEASPIAKDSDGKFPIVIVGNKSDRVTEREVSTQEGQALADRLNCFFKETSAKNNLNVDSAFKDVVLSLQKQRAAAADVQSPTRSAAGFHSRTSYKDKNGKSTKCVIF